MPLATSLPPSEPITADTFNDSQAHSSDHSPSAAKSITVIATLAGITLLNSMGTGILIAALPRIAADLALPPGLLLWPAAVSALSAGCLLLPLGAVADVLGAKRLWVLGSFLFLAFTLGVANARSGAQLIVFRTLLGAAVAMCLPTAVGLVAITFPRGGSWRVAAFAVNGMAQPLGFALGLVLGGVFVDTIGWRWAYNLMAVVNLPISVASIWSLPAVRHRTEKSWTRRLAEDIDWLGAIILSVALGLLLYVLAATTSSYRNLKDPQNVALLAVSVCLAALFPLWMSRQQRHGRPALIPNQLWRNAAFTSVCISVFFGWASLTCMEYYSSLYFQQVESIPALQSSIRFLPNVIWGVIVNLGTGVLVSRVNVQVLAVGSALISMVAPVLMATVRVGESYWLAPFWAMLLSPTNPDVLFTVSNIVISDAFPAEVQSLAGGVFNEVAQFGNSVGLTVSAAIAASVTEASGLVDPKAALMVGYRAAFWTIFASTTLVAVVVLFGLKRGGTVGKKND